VSRVFLKAVIDTLKAEGGTALLKWLLGFIGVLAVKDLAIILSYEFFAVAL